MKPRILAGIGSLFLLVVAGCSGTSPVGVEQAALAKAIPTATPKPTPTPHPLEKYITAHRIPVWAQGKVINDVPVKPGDKPFALTFDDGPWPEYTQQILNILAEHDAKATFYMVGQMVQEYPKIAVKVRDAGHAIGNHSWSHPSRPKDAVAQVQKTNAQIKKVVGFTPTTFRPPYGLLKNGMAKEAMKQRQAVLIWSADSNDWRKPNPERMARTIINQATPGGVALFHDGGGSRQNTVRALPIILRELKARGYRFVTVPELLNMRYVAPPKPKATQKPAAKAQAKPIKNP
jgi:peptidoglycan/xylan/chitin deacetylase (PgdA/CDA1 family)